MGFGLPPQSCKLCFDTCKSLFRCWVAGFHSVADEVLIIEGPLEVPIDVADVGVQDFCNVIQLVADAAG